MNWFAAKFSWISAMASLAMMLGIQTLHSPLQHIHECCGVESSGLAPAKLVMHAACGHSHGHAHSHQASSKESPCSHHHSDGHGDDCQLCQFLTQPAQLLALPVLLMGEEAVAIRPVDLLPEVVLVALAGPYVRGPPALS